MTDKQEKISWFDSVCLPELHDGNYFRLYQMVQMLESIKVENFMLTLFMIYIYIYHK